MNQHNFTSIATIHSCYKEKFGIPRQANLVTSPATIEIHETYSNDDAFRELETFSHIWVVFVFHGIDNKPWKATVRPPRLGGNQRIGVFASRSMFRPNPIGLSVVELTKIERKGKNIILHIVGGDFLDLTPVLDIKPYLPYADSINTAIAGYASEKPVTNFEVVFSLEAESMLKNALEKYPHLEKMVVEILQLDPRPAYQKTKQIKNQYAIKLYEYDLKWSVKGETIIVSDIKLLNLP